MFLALREPLGNRLLGSARPRRCWRCRTTTPPRPPWAARAGSGTRRARPARRRRGARSGWSSLRAGRSRVRCAGTRPTRARPRSLRRKRCAARRWPCRTGWCRSRPACHRTPRDTAPARTARCRCECAGRRRPVAGSSSSRPRPAAARRGSRPRRAVPAAAGYVTQAAVRCALMRALHLQRSLLRSSLSTPYVERPVIPLRRTLPPPGNSPYLLPLLLPWCVSCT